MKKEKLQEELQETTEQTQENMEKTKASSKKEKVDTGLNILPPVEKEDNTVREGVYIHKFSTPFEDSGEVYEEIEFEFSALTGDDMIAIENEMKLQGVFGEIAELSKRYQCFIAARAASKGTNKTIISADSLQRLPMKDFFKITNQVRDFLIATAG